MVAPSTRKRNSQRVAGKEVEVVMKKFVLVCSVLLFAVSVTLAAQNAPKNPPKVLTGDVVSVDAAKNLIVIKDAGGAEMTLLISSSTTITREGKGIALAEIKAGDSISSECEDSSGGCKAKSVHVKAAKTTQ
jgi:hypothetical protein